MKAFRYFEPATLSETFHVLREFGDRCKILAGGTDLIVRCKEGHISPEAMVSISQIDCLRGLEKEKGRLVIGAMNGIADLANSLEVGESFPALAQACRLVGSVQIRNRATIGGNICNAAPSADTIPPLLVYDASVSVADAMDTKWISLEDILFAPGKVRLLETELLSKIAIPLLNLGAAPVTKELRGVPVWI